MKTKKKSFKTILEYSGRIVRLTKTQMLFSYLDPTDFSGGPRYKVQRSDIRRALKLLKENKKDVHITYRDGMDDFKMARTANVLNSRFIEIGCQSFDEKNSRLLREWAGVK